MSRTILVTGGGASGKSRWAVSYFEDFSDVLYISSDKGIADDIAARMKYGIEKHGVSWKTTCFDGEPADAITGCQYYIYDNLACYVSGLIDKMCKDPSNATEDEKKMLEEKVIKDANDLIQKVQTENATLIIITFETTFSVRPENGAQRLFRDVLGILNQRMANACDEVYLSVSGIQMKIK